VRGAISDSAMRPIVIVLLDPAADAGPCFFQAAMEPSDVAVALRMMVGRPSMSDAEPLECLQEARRSELRAIVRGQRHETAFATKASQEFSHGIKY
jgi:hypothetical protein